MPDVAVPADDLPSAAIASGVVPDGDLPSAPTEKPGRSVMDIVKGTGRDLANPSNVIRPLARGAIGAVTFIPDIATTGANLIGGAIDKAAGIKEPDIEMPSSFWNRQLDKALPPPESKLGRAAETVSSAIVTGGLGGLAAGERAAAGAITKAVEQPVSRVTTKAAEDAYVSGYKLPPSYIGGTVRKTVQTIAGGPKVEKEFSKENEAVTDRLAKLALGVHPNEDLTEGVLDRIKNEAYQPYEQVRKLGTMPADPLFDQAAKNAGGRFAQRSTSYGAGYRYASVGTEKEPYLNTKEVDAGETLDEIRALRFAAKSNLKQYNPEANALGLTQRELANALEERIHRFALTTKNPGLVKQLQAAREQLAKISNVEDAIGAGGHVDALDFARMLDKGVPLSDSLKTIAVTAKNFPKAVQNVAAQGETGVWSAVDYLLGGSGLLSGHPAISSLAIMRPVSRWALRTEGAQKSMIEGLRKPSAGPIKKAVTGATRAASKTTTKAVGAAARGGAILGSEALAEDRQKESENERP